MKFVLANILGDEKGENVLYSRFGNNITSHIARDCNVLTVYNIRRRLHTGEIFFVICVARGENFENDVIFDRSNP